MKETARFKGILKKLLLLLAATFLIPNCSIRVPETKGQIKQKISRYFPVESYVKVEKTIWAEKPILGGLVTIAVPVGGATGSGVLVSYKRQVTVLTAGHLCEQSPNGAGQSFSVTDINGAKHASNLIYSKFEPGLMDLCLLTVDKPAGLWVVPVSEVEPEKGELIKNIASPFGIVFIEGGQRTVPLFYGIYHGAISKNYSLCWVPSQIGSSGSMALNANDQIIGILVMINTRVPGMAYMINVNGLKNFFDSIPD